MAKAVKRRRLAQEVDDTYGRALTGGFFYLLAWLVVGGYGGAFGRTPAFAWGLCIGFVALAAARFLHRPPRDADERALNAWLVREWSIVIVTSVLWSAAFAWAVLDPAFDRARTAALLTTIMLSTAFAHTFSMRRGFAFAGILILYAPGLALLWTFPDERPNTLVMTVYFVYVLAATLRSHAEYQRRLDLDQELRDQRDLFAMQSRVDALTGLANRRQFADTLGTATGHARETGDSLAMLVFDLDHFKAVNDTHGHAVGDACLVSFAQRLREEFGGGHELAARLGGEEFGVLLENHDTQAAQRRAERFRAGFVARPLDLDGLSLRVTVSIGVAQFDPGAHRNGDGLYRAADRAVYRAKTEGRNRVCTDHAPAHATS